MDKTLGQMGAVKGAVKGRSSESEFDGDAKGFLFEPEYSWEEILERRALREQAAAAASANPPAAKPIPRPRVGSNWWCSCTNCPAQDREISSICCHEYYRGQDVLREVEEMTQAMPA